MSRVLTEAHLRKIILQEMHEESGGKEHRCFGGDMVPFGSPDCIADLEMRIDDATHQRNGCATRTDSRDYYNGLLKVLRRDLRSANKEGQIMHPTVEEEPALADPLADDEEASLEDLIINAL
tara:strand:+ start:137 stop:502 length:366 start_codon:yes stop_codon:yes gene_type:complete